MDSVLPLHGHMSDEFFVFAVKQGFVGFKSMQRTREIYAIGLRTHPKSSAIYLEAFNCELETCQRKITRMSNSGNFKTQYKS